MLELADAQQSFERRTVLPRREDELIGGVTNPAPLAIADPRFGSPIDAPGGADVRSGDPRGGALKRPSAAADAVAVSLLCRGGADGAGAFAQNHYDELHRAWKHRVRPKLPLAFLPALLIFAALSLIWPHWRSFYAGLALGVVASMYLLLLDSPPEWIAKWARGAEGERRTARELRRLRRRGWVAVHDVRCRWGNHDHVAAGPGGVFLLETKTVHGTVGVDGDTVTCQRGDDPIDAWSQSGWGPRVRAQASELQRELRASGVRWVHPVVVIWGDFPAGVTEQNRVTYVHGDELAGWLQRGGAPGQAATAHQLAAVKTLAGRRSRDPASHPDAEAGVAAPL